MNAFLMFLVFVSSIIFYGNGLPYGNLFSKYKARDDYYEDFYLKKIPKLKVSPNKIKEFLFNHLSWFPIENLHYERNGLAHTKGHGRRRDIWNMAVEDLPSADLKLSNITLKDICRDKVKEFSATHHISNWTAIKNDTSKSMHKVKDMIKHSHFKDMLKNATHPLRYKGSKHGNVTEDCEHHPDHNHNRTHPKSSHVEKIKALTFSPPTSSVSVSPHCESSVSCVQPTIQQQQCPCPPDPCSMISFPPVLMQPSPSSQSQMNYNCPPPLQQPIPTTNFPENFHKVSEYPIPSSMLPGTPQIPHDFTEPPDYILPEDRSKPKDNTLPPNPQPNASKFPKILSGHKKVESSSNQVFQKLYPRRYRNLADNFRNLKIKKNYNRATSIVNGNGDSKSINAAEKSVGEEASDLHGGISSLWHCVLGSPRIPNTRDIKFYLYTRRNIIQPELMQVNFNLINSKIQTSPKHVDINCIDILPEEIENFERISDENREIIKSNFLNIRAPTKILIHGYTGSYRDSRMTKIKDAYVSNGRYNVILVDWEMLAAPPCYIRVTHHSRFVGETIAQFLNGLYLVGVNMSMIHLVGFSLGAQVAGFTGNNATVIPVCRITGLDPALPLFLHTQPSGHLDRLDAKFVDVIHTCGGILAMLDPLGHVDFYPNGGTRQPGCEFSNLKCSHSRAPQYFAESVGSQKKFKGQLCFTWEEYVSGDCNNSTNTSFMGEPCSRRSVDGKYYLITKSKEPFAL